MKFHLGQCVATRGAIALMEREQVNVLHLLMRHANGDDGDLDPEDKERNRQAIASGEERVFSSYILPCGEKLWIITEWDRSVTTVLMPDEY